MAYIEFSDVTKVYGSGDAEVHALDGASFEVDRGELAVILGASGAGKTTALNILGGMDTATSGRVVVDGRDVSSASEDDSWSTAAPTWALCSSSTTSCPTSPRLRMSSSLPRFAPTPLRRRVPAQGGPGRAHGELPLAAFRWRAAARIHRPSAGQEPQAPAVRRAHGRLDYQTGKQVLQLLQDTCRRDGITVLIITHNSALAPMADRLIRFKSGRVTDMRVNATPTPIADIEW